MIHADDGDLRLEGGVTAEDGSAEVGRLEIFASGGWGTVCDMKVDARGVNDALPDASIGVACEQLGFASGERTGVVRVSRYRSPPVNLQVHNGLAGLEYCPIRLAYRAAASVLLHIPHGKHFVPMRSGRTRIRIGLYVRNTCVPKF